ncbi:quinoprotein dehydrogenase-associated SoxYZ-like carrier [Paraburkholderia sp. DD10]|jgi:sulfur-oxidizing protein SoxY|uniref:quinoprotein dehydrogenase-associated SoxYZ-like carrier n=1 Tax=Paraburkholderia TaxID=1822464 RepID=UPI001D0C7930|nr:quinoprotein dehydrogenase-associated SoxYZ-like carrier [Paraburkholderia terricola]MDR6444358.1 sulfur-oxidizing protein SoxY [Paraburkholderia terricola]
MQAMKPHAVTWAAGFALVSMLTMGHVTQAAQSSPDDDPNKVASWLDFRAGTFQDRPIDAHGDAVIKLDAPKRAADAAIVPISITAQFPQTPTRYIRKIYLFIDQNPEPYAGWFEFTPESGRASIETRVRVEDYTFMRAIAETNDGRLYSAVRFVKASGGCSAPAGKDDEAAAANVGKMRLRTEGAAPAGQPQLAQLMISHPNRTGMAMNQITRMYASAYYVRKIDVTYAGKPVMTANVNFSISENPNFRFYFMPRGSGELKAAVQDTQKHVFESAISVPAQGVAAQPAPAHM